MIDASILLWISLTARERFAAPMPAPAMPPTKLDIFELDIALSWTAEPLETLEEFISADRVLPISFTATIAAAASPPEPAKLSPIELMLELSCAFCMTLPPTATVEPPRMDASTVLLMALPRPVAFTETPPEPATPAVMATISALECASKSTPPEVELIVDPVISALTVFAMLFPTSVTFTAPRPDPATPTTTDTIFAEPRMEPRLVGEDAVSLSSSVCWADDVSSSLGVPGLESVAVTVMAFFALTVELLMMEVMVSAIML